MERFFGRPSPIINSERHGTRLLNRTTREVRLTESGGDFYDRGMKLPADLEEAKATCESG